MYVDWVVGSAPCLCSPVGNPQQKEAMGRGKAVPAKPDKKVVETTGVPKWAYLGKASLACYPDEGGNAL